MTPLKHSKNVAARMGRWSAGHWKTAVVAWFAFVFLAVFAGMQVGTKTIDPNDRNVGESRTADHIIDEAGFNVDRNGETVEEQGEMVLFQATSKSVTVHDPAFRAAIADADRTLSKFRQVPQPPLAARSGRIRPDLEGRPLGDDPVHAERHVRRGQCSTSTSSSRPWTRSRRGIPAS